MKVEFIDGEVEVEDWKVALAGTIGALIIAGPLAFKCLLLLIERLI